MKKHNMRDILKVTLAISVFNEEKNITPKIK